MIRIPRLPRSRFHLPPILTRPPFDLALRIAGVLVVLYYLIVGTGAIAIYHYNAHNWFTDRAEAIFPYPAAIVDGTVIPLDRYRREVSALTSVRSKQKLATSDADIRKSVMNRLIDTTLYQDALKRSGRTVSDAETDSFLDGQASQIGGKENLVKFIREEYGGALSYEDFRLVTKELLIRSLVEKESLIHLHVSHILIAVPENAGDKDVAAAKQKIDDIRKKIASPADFGAVAKQYSEDVVSRDKNGDLGTTSKGPLAKAYSPEFENYLFSLQPNAVSDPIRSKHGWHLLLVDKKEGNINEGLESYTAQLRDAAGISVYMEQ